MKLHVRRRRLRSGLTLLAAQTRAAPTLAVACSFEINQLNERPQDAGIANLVGDTLDEGTERWSGDELAELVEGLGGYLRVGANGAALQVAAHDAKQAVAILKEVALRPKFPAKAFRRARALTISDLESELDDPRAVAGKRFRALVYGDHPYAREPKGSIETLDSLTPAKLKRFHEKWYTPDNALCVAVGAEDPEALLDLLEKTFKSWKGEVAPVSEAPELLRPNGVVAEHIVYDRAQVQVFLGHAGIRRSHPDYYRLMVMDHVLGTGPGFTSRIARSLRDEQGLCYAVGAGITGSAGREPGMFQAYNGTSPAQEETAIDGFLTEMRRIRMESPTEPELADVKAYLTGSYVWAMERNANLANFLVRAERFDLGDDFVERFPDFVNSVTVDEVRAVAEEHLDPDNYYLVTLGPKAA